VAASESKKDKLKAFMREWFLVNWKDLSCMAFVGAIAFGVRLSHLFTSHR
jgi:hypothetical protein